MNEPAALQLGDLSQPLGGGLNDTASYIAKPWAEITQLAEIVMFVTHPSGQPIDLPTASIGDVTQLVPTGEFPNESAAWQQAGADAFWRLEEALE